MKTKELRERETDVLKMELADKQKQLYTLRSQAVTEKLENPSLLRRTRRDIAQIKTVLRQRELASKQQEPAAPAAGAAAAQ